MTDEPSMNDAVYIGCAAILAFAVRVDCDRLARRYALRNAIMDIPNVRSSHATPTPRGGGLAIVLVFMGALILLVSQTDVLQSDVAHRADRRRRSHRVDRLSG